MPYSGPTANGPIPDVTTIRCHARALRSNLMLRHRRKDSSPRHAASVIWMKGRTQILSGSGSHNNNFSVGLCVCSWPKHSQASPTHSQARYT